MVLILIALLTSNKKCKRRCWIAAVVSFFVFTNQFISNQALRLVETKTIAKHELEETYDAGILLGGMVNFKSDTTLISFNSNGDRLFQTMDLYQSGYIDKILISSGSGLVQLPSFKEAYLAKKYLVSIGFPERDILIETNSRNTYENAVQSKGILEDYFGTLEGRKFLLITSASHMRRAMGCFKKQSIPVTAYSTTTRSTSGPFVLRSEMILPDPQALEQWNIVMYELTGILVYKLQGYL